MSDEELLDMYEEWSGGNMEELIVSIVAEKMKKVIIKKEESNMWEDEFGEVYQTEKDMKKSFIKNLYDDNFEDYKIKDKLCGWDYFEKIYDILEESVKGRNLIQKALDELYNEYKLGARKVKEGK